MRILWESRYDRTVTAYLYSLRGSEAGTTIHEAIKALQFENDPTANKEPIEARANRYQFEISSYSIRIEVLTKGRKVIKVLSINPV